MLEGITTLHFRKHAPSASADSLSRVHPDGSGLEDQFANEDRLGADGANVDEFLRNSKKQAPNELGLQSIAAPQTMFGTGHKETLGLLTEGPFGATIPAWKTSQGSRAASHGAAKSSRVSQGSCYVPPILHHV